MQRRTELRDPDRMAGHVLEALEPGGIGLIRDDDADALEAGMLPGAGADYLQRALRGEIEECRRHAAGAEVAIAGSDRDRDRLRRIEHHQLRVETLRGEKAFVEGDHGRSAAEGAHGAELHMLGGARGSRRDQGRGEAPRSVKREARKSDFITASLPAEQ